MPAAYTINLPLEECLSRLNSLQRETRLDNGYHTAITVESVSEGTGLYRVQVTRRVRTFRRERKRAIYVFLKRTGGSITQVRIRNAEQITPMILGALLLGFGIILALRQLYVLAAICLLIGAVVLVILWLLYSGRLIPRDLFELVNQALPPRQNTPSHS